MGQSTQSFTSMTASFTCEHLQKLKEINRKLIKIKWISISC
jgi:hypothetical protein